MQVALKDAKRGDMVIVRDTVQATGMTRLTVNFLTSVLKSKKIVKLFGIYITIFLLEKLWGMIRDRGRVHGFRMARF